MNDDGDTKDDVKMPDGEIGDKINKLFKVDEKDTSKFDPVMFCCALYCPAHTLPCLFILLT